jgi:hypothetical protein
VLFVEFVENELVPLLFGPSKDGQHIPVIEQENGMEINEFLRLLSLFVSSLVGKAQSRGEFTRIMYFNTSHPESFWKPIPSVLKALSVSLEMYFSQKVNNTCSLISARRLLRLYENYVVSK